MRELPEGSGWLAEDPFNVVVVFGECPAGDRLVERTEHLRELFGESVCFLFVNVLLEGEGLVADVLSRGVGDGGGDVGEGEGFGSLIS